MRVSIVLPCYKSENFIANIVQDIINQTYKDWELIVVSNGPEQEPQNEIINNFVKSDNRIILFKTDIAGVSHARNLGISKASGEWLIFVDADDRLFPNHIEKYVNTAINPINKNVDVIVSGYWHKAFNEEKPHPSPLIPFRGVDYSKISIHYSALYTPFNKFIRISVLRNWGGQFPEDFTCGEDGIFAFKLLNYTQNIVAIDINGYIYNETPDSAMSKFHKNYHEALITLKSEMVSLFSKCLNKSKLQQFIDNRNYYNASWEIHNLMQQGCPYSFSRKIKEIRKIITNPELRHSLYKLNLETKSKIDNIKILLMKYKASFFLATLYLIRK